MLRNSSELVTCPRCKGHKGRKGRHQLPPRPFGFDDDKIDIPDSWSYYGSACKVCDDTGMTCLEKAAAWEKEEKEARQDENYYALQSILSFFIGSMLGTSFGLLRNEWTLEDYLFWRTGVDSSWPMAITLLSGTIGLIVILGLAGGREQFSSFSQISRKQRPWRAILIPIAVGLVFVAFMFIGWLCYGNIGAVVSCVAITIAMSMIAIIRSLDLDVDYFGGNLTKKIRFVSIFMFMVVLFTVVWFQRCGVSNR